MNSLVSKAWPSIKRNPQLVGSWHLPSWSAGRHHWYVLKQPVVRNTHSQTVQCVSQPSTSGNWMDFERERLRGSGVSWLRLWCADDCTFRPCLTLLNTNNWEIDRAPVVVAVWTSWVWCLIFAPSNIMWTRAKMDDGIALRWQTVGKDPLKENSVSNISLWTTWDARTKCMASLPWSKAFLRAGPMSFWNDRRTSLPSELSLRSGSAESSLSFSLVVWIQFFTVTPNCSSLALYGWAMSVSLKVGAMSSSLYMSSVNATS